ncbi:DMT family transporter [Nocardiopsis potens]|uniref:DMT family transporter n=1 Tax=Nocardiopsis potens TaxID=1246458 RepID=UPI00034D8C2D|nr:DMT family transporter [Nocardiopsis potens]
MFRSPPLPRTVPTALLGAGLVAAWSSGFIGAELGTGEASATTLLAWRFIAVTAVLGGWALLRRPRIPPRELALHTGIGALAQAGYLYGVVAAAEHGVAAGTSALIAALQPIAAAALAAPLLGERVTPRRAGGLALGLLGVALVVGSDLSAGGTAPAWAFLLPLAAMLSLVAASVLERRTRPRASVTDALTVQCAVSAVLFTGLAGATGSLAPPADPAFWAAVAWVVVLSTFGGYGLYWAVLARTGVTRVSALLYLTPPTTMLWAWPMFGQVPGPMSLAGLAVCAAAVALIGTGPRPRTPAKRPAPPCGASAPNG